MIFQKKNLQTQFIDRLFAARKGNILAYKMHEVGYHMDEYVLNYYMDELDDKKFRFCKVLFDVERNKVYTYITKNKDIKVGDTVTVPTCTRKSPDSKLVQVVDTFNVRLKDLDFPINKLRCVEGKLKNITCPHCGASITVDVGQKTGKCAYCSAEFYLL